MLVMIQEFGPMQLPSFSEKFMAEWKEAQIKTMVLVFFKVSEAVERMAVRMVSVLFYR